MKARITWADGSWIEPDGALLTAAKDITSKLYPLADGRLYRPICVNVNVLGKATEAIEEAMEKLSQIEPPSEQVGVSWSDYYPGGGYKFSFGGFGLALHGWFIKGDEERS